ncbi:competence-damaged protein CinA [Candidatus Termititenax persephonae]|uniref:Competence-damaged protein CinA n=1 Tax=Candidatus Termititenax persephonae TaxID=2218525 RepID=A0A388TIN8_9BACT|nr:competence-damaged protein CinA [Candidatus Termititenax persephonae]
MVEQFQQFMDRAGLEFDTNLEQRVCDTLRRRKVLIAVAESCTGGLVSRMLTSQAGSSEYFVGGAVCYTARAKIIQTGISPKTIAEYGLVSEPTALGLARGIAKRLFAQVGLGITGVAGPEAHGGRPVGTVLIGLVDKEREIVKEFFFDGGREEIQKKTAQAALGMVWLYLKDKKN